MKNTEHSPGSVTEIEGKKYDPCGGCGADHPSQRCIGCLHPFSVIASTPEKETPTPRTDGWIEEVQLFDGRVIQIINPVFSRTLERETIAQAARIAELEGTEEKLRFACQTNGATIDHLLAERDRMRGALEPFAAFYDSKSLVKPDLDDYKRASEALLPAAQEGKQRKDTPAHE